MLRGRERRGRRIVQSMEFTREILARWREARAQGLPHVDIRSKDVHLALGGYPGRDHRMPICCRVMVKMMDTFRGDTILHSPKSGLGSSLVIRYVLPRGLGDPRWYTAP